MKSRPGVTLLEVLVAIFIMGIGLLALLALFPLGATSMKNAMQDARCTEMANNAKSTCNALNLRQDPNITQWFAGDKTGVFSQPLGPDWDGPSYPVYVDPIGLRYIGPATNIQVAPRFRRTDCTQAMSRSGALDWFSLHDDLSFDANGNAGLATGVQRESRFTAAFVMKQPNLKNPAIVDVFVVCYVGRDLQIPGGETTYPVLSVTGPKTIVISSAGGRPNIKRGGWILDTTSYDLAKPAQVDLAKKYGPVHGVFYRVVDLTDVNINGQDAVELELDNAQNLGAPIRTIAVLDNVAEVFGIGTGWNQ